MNTAQVILFQINAMDPVAMFAWGAKDVTNVGDGLQFKTSGITPYKGNVYIKYNEGTDLYDIQFYRIRNLEKINDHVVEDIYAEDLVRIIDDFVG